MNNLRPSRCIDPVIKYCQGCRWGVITYPSWVETAEDMEGCCFETSCMLGYDQGRPDDEPTVEELNEFEEELNKLKNGIGGYNNV